MFTPFSTLQDYKHMGMFPNFVGLIAYASYYKISYN